MRLLITGAAGFVGSKLAIYLSQNIKDIEIVGIDNLSRRGSETTLEALKASSVKFIHGDMRVKEDLVNISNINWVIDCSANPSVLAGTSCSGCSSSQLISHNLISTLNILEFCKEQHAGLIMMSTSRVYSIEELNNLPLTADDTRLVHDTTINNMIIGYSENGISESFSTQSPLSLYGATKLASETVALEYFHSFGVPIWINRCGVIAGPGQFGKIDQGIFSYWAYSYMLKRHLAYIGFGGKGLQVRDLITPEDLGNLIIEQLLNPFPKHKDRVFNVGGGLASSLSLLETTNICKEYFKYELDIKSSIENRANDIPYYISDTSKTEKFWDWRPTKTGEQILYDICVFANKNREWVDNLYK